MIGNTNITNEDRLLLYCSRGEMTPEMEEDVRQLLQLPLDWDYLWNSACRHRIVSLLYFHMERVSPVGCIPARVMKQMEASYWANAYRNLRIQNELVTILKAFQEIGIEVLLLKGLALIETVYQNLGLRPMSDMDLLVRKEAIPEVRICMEGMGYRQNLKWYGLQAIDDHHLTFYSLKGNTVPIEIHWTIGMNSDLFPIEDSEMMEKVNVINLGGVRTRILSPEDSLIHLCFHMAYHHHCALGLMGLCDISETIHRFKGILDWSRVLRFAKQNRIGPQIYIALSLANRLQGTKIPWGVLESLSKDCSPQQILWLEQFRENSLIVEPIKWESPLARLIWINGMGNKARFLFKGFFPSLKVLVICLSTSLTLKKVLLFYIIYPFIRIKRYRFSSFRYLFSSFKRFLV
ncbi:MAG TPA: nucleotidyltransferase family protein [Nitrospiria bacterium]